MRILRIFIIGILVFIFSPGKSLAIPRPNHVTGHVDIDPNSDWEYIEGYDPVDNQSFKDACLRSRPSSRTQIQLCYSTQRNGDQRIFFYSERDSLTFPENRNGAFQVPLVVDGHNFNMNFYSTDNHFGIYPDVTNGNSRQLISMLGSGFRTLRITLPVHQSRNITFTFSGLNQLNFGRLFPATQTH